MLFGAHNHHVCKRVINCLNKLRKQQKSLDNNNINNKNHTTHFKTNQLLYLSMGIVKLDFAITAQHLQGYWG